MPEVMYFAFCVAAILSLSTGAALGGNTSTTTSRTTGTLKEAAGL